MWGEVNIGWKSVEKVPELDPLDFSCFRSPLSAPSFRIHDGQHDLEVELVEGRKELPRLMSPEEIQKGTPGGQVEGVGGGEGQLIQAVSKVREGNEMEGVVLGQGLANGTKDGRGPVLLPITPPGWLRVWLVWGLRVRLLWGLLPLLLGGSGSFLADLGSIVRDEGGCGQRLK